MYDILLIQYIEKKKCCLNLTPMKPLISNRLIIRFNLHFRLSFKNHWNFYHQKFFFKTRFI